MFGWELDQGDYTTIASFVVGMGLTYIVFKVKGFIMAVVDNLNSAVASLEAASSSVSSSVDTFIATASVSGSNDAAVQAAADKINGIAQGLMAVNSKLNAPR